MKIIETTLLLLKKDNKIMLALKKKGFGAGKYNGIGGKLELGETPEQAMLREAYEEAGIKPINYISMGENEYSEFINGEPVKLKFYLYVADSWVGEPIETEEMKPYWFDIDKIPYDNMFVGDIYWLPLVLENKKIHGYFEFDENWNLINHEALETHGVGD